MEIVLRKGKNRNILTCKREDGSSTSINLGPNIPNHDFAHYVVENKFNLTRGFFGNIKNGKTISELSESDIIQDLPPETWLSEILARNLQSLRSGGVEIEQFVSIIKWEAEKITGIEIPKINIADVCEMKQDFDNLCEKWTLLGENKEIKLYFG
ncbi:MAG: hypothetical protein ABIO60_02310 [Aquaticitalea sp.]